MGLVDYSDSESESETIQTKPALPETTAATTAAPKKPFQKLLDRGKIVVNLPAASGTDDASEHAEQPPAKRAKTTGGSRFSSFGSFLPPPKKTGTMAAAATVASKNQGSAPAPGVHLKTAAEPAFVRGGGDADGVQHGDGDTNSSGMGLPPPKSQSSSGPSIPEGQKPEEEVKLVGKPLMFKPLSVARKKAPPKKKKDVPVPARQTPPPAAGPATAPSTNTVPAPQPKKVSLFSMGDEDDQATPSAATPSDATASAYEPLFTSAYPPTDSAPQLDQESSVTAPYPAATQPQPQQPQQQQQQEQQQSTLSHLANTLPRAARRDLFGRTGLAPRPSSSSSSSPSSSASLDALIPPDAKVVTFDMEREYAHNESLRAAAAAGTGGGVGVQAYNPVRSIAPGKHSLRQVVNMAQSNQAALEEAFARQKSGRRDAAGRYGWG
ncbi:hypothetical protein VTK26DRAFT_1011 [Humicola hyalothermophila]